MPVEELTCRELVEIVTDYLEGALPAKQRIEFEKHLVMCDGCAIYLEHMRWTIELDGRVDREEGVLVAERGRLLERVEAWNAEAARDFALDCARRLRERAEADKRLRPFAEDAETQIGLGSDPKLTAVVAFIARHAAEQEEVGGWDAERARQSRVIGERVGL